MESTLVSMRFNLFSPHIFRDPIVFQCGIFFCPKYFPHESLRVSKYIYDTPHREMELFVLWILLNGREKVEVDVNEGEGVRIPQCVTVYEIPREEPQKSEVWASDKPLPITQYCGWTVEGEKVCCPDTHGYSEGM